MKRPVIIAVIIAILALGGAFWASKSHRPVGDEPVMGNSWSVEQAGEVENIDSVNSLPVSVGQIEDAPMGGGSTKEALAGFTLKDVAEHGTEDSCWTAISGVVYDLSDFALDHPGGKKAILNLCGKDGTRDFEAAHGDNKDALSALGNFKIGVLVK